MLNAKVENEAHEETAQTKCMGMRRLVVSLTGEV
jgi:hypothetical protein